MTCGLPEGAFSDGGIGSIRAGGVASSPGECSLAGLRSTTVAGAISREPGESVNAGSGPWEEGWGGGDAISGTIRCARPGRMYGPLGGKKLRDRRAWVKSAFIADAICMYWACAAAGFMAAG